MNKKSAIKTTLHSTLAGVLFVSSILILNTHHFLAIVLAVSGAFFDWLPYIKKWMGNIKNKKSLPKRIGKMPVLIMIHTVVALLTYAVWILWVFVFFNVIFGWIFFTLWLIVYAPEIFHQFFKFK